MIAAPVQRDVDGIPKESHYVRVRPIKVRLVFGLSRTFPPLEPCEIRERPAGLAHEREARLRHGTPQMCERNEIGIDPDFADDETTPGLQDSEQFSECAVPIRDLAERANQVSPVERVGEIR